MCKEKHSSLRFALKRGLALESNGLPISESATDPLHRPEEELFVDEDKHSSKEGLSRLRIPAIAVAPEAEVQGSSEWVLS